MSFLLKMLKFQWMVEIQPFSQKSRTVTVPKVFQIGLCGVVEADLELFWDSWSVGILGEWLYAHGLGALLNGHTSVVHGCQYGQRPRLDNAQCAPCTD